MLLRMAQLAPFRPAKAKHLVQNAGTFQGEWYPMQFTAADLCFGLGGGCHLVSSGVLPLSVLL